MDANTNSASLTLTKRSELTPWVVCLSASLFFFYELIQMNMFNAIDKALMSAFSLNAHQLGHLSAIFFDANVLFLIPAGLLLDRYATRKIILVSMSLCVLGTFMFGCAHSYTFALFCRFLTGIGSAFVFLSCIRIASRWFPSQKMALLTGVIITVGMFGGVMAQTPLTILTDTYGWRNALFIDAIFGCALLLIIAAFVRDAPDEEEEHQKQEEIAKLGYIAALKRAYTRSQNWFAAIYTCFMNIPLSLLGVVWGSPYLMRVYHLSVTDASIVISQLFLGTIVGAPLVGYLSDRFKQRRVPMIIGCLFSFGTIILILSSPHLSVTNMVLLFFCLGLFTSTQVLSYTMVTESAPAVITATSVGVISLLTQGGAAFFQPIFGHLLQQGWSGKIVNHVPVYSAVNFQYAMMIIPIGFIISFIAVLFLKETYQIASTDKIT